MGVVQIALFQAGQAEPSTKELRFDTSVSAASCSIPLLQGIQHVLSMRFMQCQLCLAITSVAWIKGTPL